EFAKQRQFRAGEFGDTLCTERVSRQPQRAKFRRCLRAHERRDTRGVDAVVAECEVREREEPGCGERRNALVAESAILRAERFQCREERYAAERREHAGSGAVAVYFQNLQRREGAPRQLREREYVQAAAGQVEVAKHRGERRRAQRANTKTRQRAL